MSFFVRQKVQILSKILPKSWICQFTMHYFSLFIKFRQISSKTNIFVTTASFRHFVSFFLSKTKSFGAYRHHRYRWLVETKCLKSFVYVACVEKQTPKRRANFHISGVSIQRNATQRKERKERNEMTSLLVRPITAIGGGTGGGHAPNFQLTEALLL